MKYLFTFFLILSLVTAVFGFSAMNHYANDGKMVVNDCTVPFLNGVLCLSNGLNMVMHHISAYQIFSQIPVDYFGFSILLLFSIFIIGIFLLLNKYFNLYFKSFLHFIFSHQYSSNIKYRSKHKILNWLSLLEFSPAL